jgi:hypothetical protein
VFSPALCQHRAKEERPRPQPIIFYTCMGTCWQPYVKGLTIMVNSLFNGNRLRDISLDC